MKGAGNVHRGKAEIRWIPKHFNHEAIYPRARE
jgi:hypothetical protein